MEPLRPAFDDLGGGLNEGANPGAIADNQFVLLENFFPFEKRLIRRNGVFRKTTAPYGGDPTTAIPLTGLIHFRAASGTMYPLFGTPQGFARYVGADTGVISDLAPTWGIPVLPNYSLLPWVMVQMNGVAYAMRKDAFRLNRVTESGWDNAGIDAPAAAATIGDGGAGTMAAGDYALVYTFYNSATGAESNYSPVSNTLTQAVDHSLVLSGLELPANPQVNTKRLYLTAPGTSDVYLWVKDVPATDTVAAIDVPISAMGAIASVNNGLPPVNLIAGDIFLDSYLVATDGVDVFVSEPFRPESFSEFNVFDVFKNDGAEVRAVRAFGDRVVIGKTNKVHYFTKTGNLWNRETLNEDSGCYSHHSMQVADNSLIWYGGDDFYLSDGHTSRGIGSTRIKKLLARIPANRKEYVAAAVYPKYGWYVASCYVDPAYLDDPTDSLDEGDFASGVGAVTNNVMVVYNYRTGAWCTFTAKESFAGGGAPAMLMHSFGPDFEQALYAVFYNSHYYQMDRGTTDGNDTNGAGVTIRARFRTKAYRFTPFGLVSAVRRVFLKITSVAASITLRLYRDEDSTAIKTRAGLTLADLDYDYPRETKGFNLASGQKGALWQIEGEYDAEPSVEIEGIAAEVIPRAERVRMR